MRCPFCDGTGEVVNEGVTLGALVRIDRAALAALAVPDKGVQGDQGDMASRSQPCADAQERSLRTERIMDAREYAMGLQQVAWSRQDGGQDLTRSAMIIDGLCDLLEAL